MNSLEELLHSPVVHRLGWGLIHFLWEGAVIVLLLSAALVLLRRRSANTRYLTAFAALVLMVVSLPVTFGLVPDTLLFQSPKTKTEIEEPRQETLSAQFSGEKRQQSPNEENPRPLPQSGNINSPSPQVWAPIPAEKTDPSVVSPTAVSPASTPVDNSPMARLLRIVQAAVPWTVFLWLVGITLLSLFHLGGWLSLRRLCAGSFPVPAFVQQRFQQLMTRMQMSRSVRLLESARVVVPSLIGLFRPVILLPGSVLTGLTMEQLEAVLAHELAHIRRHDYLLNLLQTAMETLLFYHPAVWWVGKVIRKERENCCDDLALKVCEDRVQYARALAELAGLSDTPRLAVTMNSPKGELLPRIQRVLGLTSPDPSRSGSWLVVGMGMLLTGAMIFGCLAAQDGTLEQKTQAEEMKETWRVLPDVGLGQMSNICFVDEGHAWLAFSDGSLLRTTDVGKTWHSVPLPDSGGSRDGLLIQLLKRLNGSSFGWAISGTGKIFHTSDGLTWEQQKPPLKNVKNRISIRCLDVLDENHAWISGYGMTWRTTNGGRSWENIQSGLRGDEPFPSKLSTAEEHRFIHFRDKNNGTALVATGFGWKTRITTDGGKTWHSQENTIPYQDNSGKTILRSGRAVRVYSDGGLLIYGHGDLPIDDTMFSQLLARKSVSAGYRIESHSDRYYSIVSKDSIAAFEKIYRNSSYSTSLHFTGDGGKHWSQRFLATHLSSIHFVDQIHGWAVGPAGRVSRTLDGGETWVHTFLPTDADFHTVYFLDEKTGWLGGGFSTHGASGLTALGKGCVWRTMDGGETWERVSQIENGRTGKHSHPETIHGLVFKNREDGWVVTHGMTKEPQKEINGSTPLEYGRILYTDNGGGTWAQVYYEAPLKDIALRDNRWCAAGYRIVHSEDGIKWENAAPGSLVNGVAFADNLNVFAVGERSAVGHSSTAGAQWSWTQPFKQSLLSAVSFGSPKIGWIAGNASADGEDHGLFATSDGGKTWQAAQINWPVGYSTIHHNWQDICAVDSQHAWAVGTSYGRAVILRFGSGATSRASARSNTPRLSSSLKHLESVTWTNSGRHHTATLKLKSDYTYELKETQRYEKEITTTRKGKWRVLSQPLALIALDGKHLVDKHGVRIFQTNASTTKGRYERVALRQQRLRADDRPAEWLKVAKDWYALLPHLAKHTSEVMVVPLPKPEAEAIDLERLTVPDSIQRQVSPLVKDGWRSEVLGNAVLVTRNKKAEIYNTINLPEHSGVEDLRKMNMTIDQRYVITLRVGPKVSLEEYRKKKVENAETYKQLASLREKMRHIPQKFYSYLPSTPEERKLVEQHEKLKKSRHDLPDSYSETHSIWISESIGWGEAFADEAVGKECREVHGKIVDLFRSYERSDKTKAAVEELKATLDTLTVDLVFRGKTHNYNDSLTLLGPKAQARDTDRPKLMLTTSDLSKIVQTLADSGFFDRAKDVRRKTSLKDSNETVYTLTLRTVAGGPYWVEELQRDRRLIRTLQVLRTALSGDIAKNFDALIAEWTALQKTPQRSEAATAAKPPIDLGNEGLQIEKYPADKLPAGLFAVGFYVTRDRPNVRTVYRGRLDKSIIDGYRELVGRMPGDFDPGLNTFEVERFERIGSKITAVIKRVDTQVDVVGPNVNVYVRAYLPLLPPGKYSVEISFRDVVHEDGVRLTPAKKTRDPISCQFEVPASDAVAAELKKLVEAAIAKKPATGRQGKTEQNPTGLNLLRVVEPSLSKAYQHTIGLENPNVDRKIETARALLKLADLNTVAALLAAAKSNNYFVSGSENATLHSIYRSTLKRALEKITGLALTPKGLKVTIYGPDRKPRVVRSEDDPKFFAEQVDFRKVEDWLRVVYLADGSDGSAASNILKQVKSPKDRDTLSDLYEKVRGGKHTERDELRYVLPLDRKPMEFSLEKWHDLEDSFQLTAADDNWLLFRSKQVDDNDSIWIERIERRGNTFTVTIQRAIWNGDYAKNVTFHELHGVNFGRLPAGKYTTKWVIHTSTFDEFDEDRQPKDLQPTKVKPVELEVAFTVATARAQAGAEQPTLTLTELVSAADRIVVATTPWQSKQYKGQINLQATRSLKGANRIGTGSERVHKIEGMQQLPADAKKQWIFFLRSQEEGNPLPQLYPAAAQGWFMPYSDQLADKIRAAIALPKEWSEINNGLRIGLRLPTARATIGDELRLEICIQNAGRTPIGLWQHRYNIYDYWPSTHFEVTAPDGKTWWLAKPEGAIKESDSPSMRTLQPGETYIHTMRLNHWPAVDPEKPYLTVKQNVFDLPGAFSIRFYDLPIVDGKTLVWGGRLVSKPITLTLEAAKKPDKKADAIDEQEERLGVSLSAGQRAVAEIKKLGGHIELEGQMFGHTLYQPSVSLHGKRVTDASLVVLKAIPNLRELGLGRCLVTDSGLAQLKGFSELKVLALYGSPQFTDAGLVHLKELTNIVDLSLRDMSITDAGLENLKGMMKLSRLNLYGTQVWGGGLVHLKRLTLRRLNLARTKVGNAGLQHLKGQTALRELNLDDTHVADQDLVYLKSLENLRTLNLEGTRVSDAGLQHLKFLTNLKTLRLSHTKVTDGGANKLRQTLPKCTIER